MNTITVLIVLMLVGIACLTVGGALAAWLGARMLMNAPTVEQILGFVILSFAIGILIWVAGHGLAVLLLIGGQL